MQLYKVINYKEDTIGDQLKEATKECEQLGLLRNAGKNLNDKDVYLKTDKGERIFKEIIKDAKNGKINI